MERNVIARFIRYVKYNTQSDPDSNQTPSSPGQLIFACELASELTKIGMTEVDVDDKGYVMATIPANIDQHVPVIGFIAHLDTSPDFNGKEVLPQIITGYSGGDLYLDKEHKILLSPSTFPDLNKYVGEDLIVTDGNTLLGADDKAGVAEIVSAMEYLVNHPEIKHGKVRIGFTPDEEIGQGADHFDVKKFGADFAYTIDGGERGELEFENFNASSARIEFHGVSVHPGYAIGKMINAIHLANELINLLPANERPENTEEREGFYHISSLKGNVNHAVLDLIIRDFDEQNFSNRKIFLDDMVQSINHLHGSKVAEITIKDQYHNMKKMIDPVYQVVEIANEAIESCGIKSKVIPIRGGTDGARLSYMGLPCPNIFSGGHNFHGRFEFISTRSLLQACQVIVAITERVALLKNY